MDQPFSYYGGKQNLVSEILPLLIPHNQYVEPFTGGGTVFWRKKASNFESINDIDNRIINFYECLKNDFDRLENKISLTMHSESQHTLAKEILKAPIQDKIDYAWAFWVQCNLSFSFKIFGGFRFSNGTAGGGEPKGTYNKRDEFTKKFSQRLHNVEIFCRDAIDLIDLKDSPTTFFYCDPPYVSSGCGHYKGYTLEQFKQLLDKLSTIKGKFLLSSYPEDILMEYRKDHRWKTKDIRQVVSVTGKRKDPKLKIECLTMNYQPPQMEMKLF